MLKQTNRWAFTALNEVSRQIYDTLTQLACMLAMLQSGIHVWPELCYKKHRKSNKITKKKLI